MLLYFILLPPKEIYIILMLKYTIWKSIWLIVYLRLSTITYIYKYRWNLINVNIIYSNNIISIIYY